MENYHECYKIYIINKRFIPQKEWWREFAILMNPLMYIEDYKNEFNLPINIEFIKHYNKYIKN